MNTTIVTMMSCTCFIGVVVFIVLMLMSKRRDKAIMPNEESVQLKIELEKLQNVSKAKEENLLRRIEDKEVACQQLIANMKDTCDIMIQEKANAVEHMLQEKENACVKLLAEKDIALHKKEETWNRMMKEKDDACNSAIEEKERACAKLLEEKDRVLKQKDIECAKMLSDRDQQCAQVIREKNTEIERFLKEKEKTFAEALRTLQEQFANLAAQTLKIQSADLSALNKTHLEAALKPLREQVVRLQDLTQKAQSESVNLGQTITKDVGTIGKIARELSNVATALSSNTRVQGRKGEEILAEKLRQAGLEENVNFFLQSGMDSDRPDAQVCDTENRWLIIDSKVSLTSYMECVEATDETVRAAKLASHVESVRKKIDQLAKKKYPRVFAAEYRDRNYLPITAMFVPYEAPLMVALQEEPSLWQYAAQNNVILVTPLTLLAYLRLVYLAWQHEKENRNQIEIVNTARELLTRMNSFLLTFESVGKAISSLQDTYDKARNVIVDAPHAQTIAKSAQKLIGLHVKLENRRGNRLEMAKCLKTDGDGIVERIQESTCMGIS